MKILITGANGFIARSLFEEFENKYQVISRTREELDLLDSQKVLEYISENKFDVVIHAATYHAYPKFSTKDVSKVLENNLRMFFNIAKAKSHFGKMIYFGSGAEFNRENWIPKMKEEYFGQHIPSDQYGFSKYLMNEYTTLNNDNIYNLRLFGIFGKYDDWRYRFIPNICARAALDMPITINQNLFLDFLYIDDLVKIVDWFLNNKPQKNSYNVCTGVAYELKDLASKVLKISGKDLEIQIKKEGLGTEYSGNNLLLMNELNDFTFTPMNESIKTLLNWYCNNQHLINKLDCERFL